METKKIANDEISEEMQRYLKDMREQMEKKEGILYDNVISKSVDSIEDVYNLALKQGYDLDKEEFFKVADDGIKVGESMMGDDGELSLEALDIISGGVQRSSNNLLVSRRMWEILN